jgi:hypothetical protein
MIVQIAVAFATFEAIAAALLFGTVAQSWTDRPAADAYSFADSLGLPLAKLFEQCDATRNDGRGHWHDRPQIGDPFARSATSFAAVPDREHGSLELSRFEVDAPTLLDESSAQGNQGIVTKAGS